MSGLPFLDFIETLVEGNSLNREQATRAFQIIMSGGATPAQIAAFLVSMRIKGETIDEITGAAHTMRHNALRFEVPEGTLDTCGTGGDASGSYNISTATAIVAAACGVPVVKHGNRSVSSRSGSADVMQRLGVNLNASAETMQQALKQCGLCFLMAPAYHQAMRHVAPIRQELRMRTIFNLLGPLSNPANVPYQLLGVYSPDLVRPLAEVLKELGTKAAWVVHGHGGMDEISLTGPTQVAALEEGRIREFEITPQQAGLEPCEMEALKGGDAKENAEALDQLLSGRPSAYRDMVCLNTAATLMITGRCDSLKTGAKKAATAIDNGDARYVLHQLVTLTEKELEDEN